jgi:integrase
MQAQCRWCGGTVADQLSRRPERVAARCGSQPSSRPSKSLTLAQAADLLTAAKKHPTMHAYIVLSLLTGARTEELRALTWSHVNLDGEPPSVQLWRSVREGGDTKTRLSRRTLELPNECVVALERTDAGRPRVARATRHDGPTMILSSRRNAAPLSPRPTFGVRSAR